MPPYNSRQDASSDTQRSPWPIELSASDKAPWPSSQRNSVVTGSNMLDHDPMVTGRARRRRQTGQRRRWAANTQIPATPTPPRKASDKAPWPSSQRNSVVTGSNMLDHDAL